MKRSEIRIEPPRSLGDEIEFFIQSALPGRVSCSLHIHSAIELLYVKEGSYKVYLNDETLIIEQGDLVLFCSNTMHHVVAGDSPKNSYYVVKIAPSFFINFSKNGMDYMMRFAIDKKGKKNLWKSEELAESYIKQILEQLIEEYEVEKYASDVILKLKVTELMVALLRNDPFPRTAEGHGSPGIIYNITNYVQSNYAEEIDEKKLAADYGMSYSYFSRTFKAVTGMTFKSYLNRVRTNKAEQLLLLENRTISEVASACGYNSISYFIKVYRSIKGVSPYKHIKVLNK